MSLDLFKIKFIGIILELLNLQLQHYKSVYKYDNNKNCGYFILKLYIYYQYQRMFVCILFVLLLLLLLLV